MSSDDVNNKAVAVSEEQFEERGDGEANLVADGHGDTAAQLIGTQVIEVTEEDVSISPARSD